MLPIYFNTDDVPEPNLRRNGICLRRLPNMLIGRIGRNDLLRIIGLRIGLNGLGLIEGLIGRNERIGLIGRRIGLIGGRNERIGRRIGNDDDPVNKGFPNRFL